MRSDEATQKLGWKSAQIVRVDKGAQKLAVTRVSKSEVRGAMVPKQLAGH